MTIDDYKINLRIGRSCGTGFYEINKQGNRKEIYKFKEYYKTDVGELDPGTWKEQLKALIIQNGEWNLTEAIIRHVKDHCAWLHTENEIEEYALEIHAGRVYRFWPDFELPLPEAIIFVG